jgi:hypothetical protein
VVKATEQIEYLDVETMGFDPIYLSGYIPRAGGVKWS